MAFFPFFMDLKGKKVVVAGGGKVALRKVMALAEYGADITVVAEDCCKELMEYLNKGKILIIKTKYNYVPETDGEEQREAFYEQLAAYMTGAMAAVLATDDAALNHAAALWCRQNGILVNTVDQTEDCDFLFPALVHRDEVTIGITTGGNSPLLAGRIREELEERYPAYIGTAAEWLGWLRQFVKPMQATEEEKKRIYGEMLEWLLAREADVAEEEVREHLREVIHA